MVRSMQDVGRRYPADAGNGSRFGAWLFIGGSEPYNSYGNGFAMRVSPVAWLFDDIDSVRRAANKFENLRTGLVRMLVAITTAHLLYKCSL